MKSKIAASLSLMLIGASLATPAALAADAKEQAAMEVRPVKIQSPLIPVALDKTLPNGLRLVVSEDHSAPVASIAIVYDVGARDEKKTRSGFAHLFEHMMFQGSQNVGKMDHFKYIESIGGSLNASTHADFTNYFEKVPANQIELCLWLESDRMRSLKVTPDNFKNQLDTVKEEKRLRIDNQPYAPANIRLEELAFDNWANAHPAIGYFEDLEASSVEDVRNFFKTYYAPNNATMAIVGDVKADEIYDLVVKYFGTIPSVQAPARPDLTEPVQTKPKYQKIEDAQAKAPAFWVAYKAPARRDKDFYALNLLQTMLSSGESSRLYQRMVKSDKVALQVSSSYEERRGPSLFQTFVVLKAPATADSARKILQDEFAKIKAEPVNAEELQKAKNQLLRGLFSSSSYASLQRSLGRAEMLAEYTSFFKDPKLIDEDIKAYMAVTARDVQDVANKVFNESGVTVVDVVPQVKAASESDKKSEVIK